MSGSRHRIRLTVKAIAAAKPRAKEYTLWDNLLAHFGVRVQPSGVRSYIVQTRVNGRMRKITLGRFPELSLDAARWEGAAVLARLWSGEDVKPPRKNKAPLFRDFAARYRARRAHRWKPSSLKTFDIYLRNRLMPHFGRLRLDAIDHVRVSAWFDAASADKPGAANRAFEILRAMLASARQWGEIGELTEDRASARLEDAKTGPRTIWLGPEAARLLATLPRPDGRDRVFPENLTPNRLYTFWVGVCEEAGLPGLRIHDCRHTWASQGVMNGVGLTNVGRLLGHRRRETTVIYAHLDDGALRDAAAQAAPVIAPAMGYRAEPPLLPEEAEDGDTLAVKPEFSSPLRGGGGGGGGRPHRAECGLPSGSGPGTPSDRTGRSRKAARRRKAGSVRRIEWPRNLVRRTEPAPRP